MYDVHAQLYNNRANYNAAFRKPINVHHIAAFRMQNSQKKLFLGGGTTGSVGNDLKSFDLKS